MAVDCRYLFFVDFLDLSPFKINCFLVFYYCYLSKVSCGPQNHKLPISRLISLAISKETKVWKEIEMTESFSLCS